MRQPCFFVYALLPEGGLYMFAINGGQFTAL